MSCSSPGASSCPSCFQRVALSRVLLFVLVAGVFSTIIGISKYFSVFRIGTSNMPKFVFRHFDGDHVATQSCKRRVLKASKRMVGKQSKCALLVPPVDDICELTRLTVTISTMRPKIVVHFVKAQDENLRFMKALRFPKNVNLGRILSPYGVILDWT